MAPRLVENVVRVTNLEAVKIEFRHLPFLILLLSSSDTPSALMRAVASDSTRSESKMYVCLEN